MTTCCDATIAHVQRQRRDATCPTCGAQYVADLDATIPRVPAALIDARVQVAGELALRPSRTPPEARRTHVEDDELVRVRRLLTELRPDRGGPLGWAADGEPPAPSGSAWTPALRVQTSVEVPAILPGAFVSTSSATRAPYTAEGTALHWLQRYGTLKDGLRALYAACAEAMSTAEARAKWKALPPREVLAAAVLHGRKLVREAMAEWWRETPPVDPEVAAAEAESRRSALLAATAGYVASETERASSATGEALALALARARGRVVTAEGASE